MAASAIPTATAPMRRGHTGGSSSSLETASSPWSVSSDNHVGPRLGVSGNDDAAPDRPHGTGRHRTDDVAVDGGSRSPTSEPLEVANAVPVKATVSSAASLS